MINAKIGRSHKVLEDSPEIDTDGACVMGVNLESAEVTGALSRVPFKMAKFSISDGSITDPDTHAVNEMWTIIEGPCAVLLGGQEFEAQTGDVFALAPHETHQVRSTGGRATVLSMWWES